MWKVVCLDDLGEPLGFSCWATLEEAQKNQRELKEAYGIEAKIEQVEEEA